MARSLLAALATSLLPCATRAQTTVSTTPVGYMTLNCLGSSDSYMSLPMSQPAVYAGNTTLATTSGVTMLTVSGTPFTVSQFKYVAGTQSNTYYALLTNGAKAGCFYTITDNGPSSLTLNLNGDDVSAVTGTITVQVVPYWTLNTVFPNGTGVTPQTGFARATQIIVPDSTTPGINNASSAIYSYFSANSAWYGPSSLANDTILYPDRYFIIRNNLPTNTSFTVAGAVVTSVLNIPVATNGSSRQDNPLALIRPTPVDLNDSGLVASGAFGSTTGFAPGDQLFVFDNTVATINKSASGTYTYSGGAWRLNGGSTDNGTDPVFAPGTGVILRKAQTSAGATVFWSNPSAYQN